MSRGNARAPIYADDKDRGSFLRFLWRVAERSDWLIWTYCLMPNHYHLVVQTAHPNLSQGMHDLNGAHSLRFNRRHHRVGHVFQGRYKSIVVDGQSYLLDLLRYVVVNPVKAGLCPAPGDWRWSSYRAMMGTARVPARLAVDAALRNFGSSPGTARRAFEEFVKAGLIADDPTEGHRVRGVAGPEAFIAQMAQMAPAISKEIPRASRAWRSLADYAREHATRNLAIRAAYASGAYSQVQIGRHFGLSNSMVSRIVGKPRLTKCKIQDLTP